MRSWSSVARYSAAGAHASPSEPQPGTDVSTLTSEAFDRAWANDGLDLVVPTRAFIDEMKTWRRRDIYFGRGSRQYQVTPSIWQNPLKMKEFGRDGAVDRYAA